MQKNDNFFPVIYLCDANRNFYNAQIKRRPDGCYMNGTNRTLKNKIKSGIKNKSSANQNIFFYGREEARDEELIENEVRHYNSIE